MMELLNILGLALWQAAALCGICFVAGVIRGFSGFALSAVVMAAAALILSPLELIPMLLILEIAASVMMIKNGFANADRRVALLLAVASAAALPIGLWLTITMPADVSRLVALSVIIVLAISQLARLRLGFLATTPGVIISGMTAGIATGLASVGGMVVALYVLARKDAAGRMRATLVMYLSISVCLSVVTHLVIGTLDLQTFWRGLFFAIPSTIGVIAGQFLFIPAWEKYYKPFCLLLLIALAVAGVLRLVLA